MRARPWTLDFGVCIHSWEEGLVGRAVDEKIEVRFAGVRGGNNAAGAYWVFRCMACNTVTLVSPSEMRSLIVALLARDSHRVWKP